MLRKFRTLNRTCLSDVFLTATISTRSFDESSNRESVNSSRGLNGGNINDDWNEDTYHTDRNRSTAQSVDGACTRLSANGRSDEGSIDRRDDGP